MTISVILIFVLAIVALIGTILTANNTETAYGKKTKGNLARLTMIYAVVILLSILVVGGYIAFR